MAADADRPDETAPKEPPAANGGADRPESVIDADFAETTETGPAPGAPTGAPGLVERLKSAASPGLIFFVAFILLAAAVFAVFALSRPDQATGPLVPGREPPADAELSAEAGPDAQSPEAEEPSATPQLEDAAEKIANFTPEGGKEAELPPLDPDAAPASARGLPPPPAGAQNDDLQTAAKDAFRIDRDDARDDGDAIDLPAGPSSDGIRFEVDGAKAPPAGEPDPNDAPASPAGAGFARLMNDDGRDGEARADDRGSIAGAFAQLQDNDDLRASPEEIASLRESFQRALAERDMQRDALEQRFAERDERLSAEIAGLRSAFDDMRAELGQSPRARRGPMAAVAFAALARAVASGDPYKEELENFARHAPDAPEIDSLSRLASVGTPDALQLKVSFESAARAALTAARKEGAAGWFGGLAARMPQLFSVRPARPEPGDAPAQILSRAEAALENGDLADAVAEIETLDGAAAEEFAGWMTLARARLAADEAVETLGARFIADYQN